MSLFSLHPPFFFCWGIVRFVYHTTSPEKPKSTLETIQHKKKSNKHIQPIEEEQRPLVLGKGRLPDEAPADAGVQLKPVTLITPPEEVYTVFTEQTIYI